MTDSTVTAPKEDLDQLHWLGMARLAALGSLFFFLVAVIVMAFLDARENGIENLRLTVWTIPLWLPYLWMYLQTKSKSTRRRKKGLALAIAYGAAALLITAPSALESTGLALQGGFALFAALQLCLVVCARKTYQAMEKEPGDARILISRVAITSACFGVLCLAAVYIPNSYKARISADESAAISAMRTIYTAQSIYAERNPQKGFAAALSELGPAPGANLIERDIANGRRFGYLFQLIAGPQDASGRVAQYTVLARPVTFRQTGNRSFFADASGTIRSTAEDRAPTNQDPPLE